jgi:hypothetical protein
MGPSAAWAGSMVFHVTQGSSKLSMIDAGLAATEARQHRCAREPFGSIEVPGWPRMLKGAAGQTHESPAVDDGVAVSAVEPVRLKALNPEARHDLDSAADP